MVKRLLLSAMLCAASLSLIGCANFLEQSRDAAHKTAHALQPRPDDHKLPADEVDSQWVNNVGREGRGDRPVEVDNDPLRKYLLTPRARDIEQNLGIVGPDD